VLWLQGACANSCRPSGSANIAAAASCAYSAIGSGLLQPQQMRTSPRGRGSPLKAHLTCTAASPALPSPPPPDASRSVRRRFRWLITSCCSASLSSAACFLHPAYDNQLNTDTRDGALAVHHSAGRPQPAACIQHLAARLQTCTHNRAPMVHRVARLCSDVAVKGKAHCTSAASASSGNVATPQH
jgi:hypothetical protein